MYELCVGSGWCCSISPWAKRFFFISIILFIYFLFKLPTKQTKVFDINLLINDGADMTKRASEERTLKEEPLSKKTKSEKIDL